MPECKVEKNKEFCSCTYTSCSKQGICCDCLQSHFKRGELPGCLFPEDVEETYDRSIEKFVEAFQQKAPWW